MIKYSIDRPEHEVSDVLYSPIEILDWDYLTVGALGWGQIQIANTNNIQTLVKHSRKEWMLELCDVMVEFYLLVIVNIGERIRRFEVVKAQ